MYDMKYFKAFISLLPAIGIIYTIFWNNKVGNIIIFSLIVISIIILIYITYKEKILSYLLGIPPKQPCPYFKDDDCPFNEPHQCKHDKSKCFLLKNARKNKTKSKLPIILLICAFVSFGIILFSSIYNSISENINNKCLPFPYLYNIKTILKILEALSISVLAGTILAFLIDIPSRIKEYKNFFVTLLTSNEYLKRLDEKQLTNLRSEVTTLLHTQDVPNMPKGLIRLDQVICNMLKQPYYKYYRQSIKVDLTSKSQEHNSFLKKDFSVEYLIFNPFNKDRSIIVDLGFSGFTDIPNNSDVKDYFKINKFTLHIDSYNEEIDMTQYIKILSMPCKESIGYNTHIFINTLENNKAALHERFFKEHASGNKKEINYENLNEINLNLSQKLNIRFKDKIKVELNYSITTPINDKIFTKRLRYPVKYFRIDYTSKTNSHKLYGQLLGTLIEQSKISTNIQNDKTHLSLETFDWLLPGNGAIIVMEENDNEIKNKDVQK